MRQPIISVARFAMTFVLIACFAVGCGSSNKGAASVGRELRGINTVFQAAQAGKTDAVIRMISEGENVNAQDEFGMTALHYAAENGHVAMLNWLMYDAGANFNLRNADGKTPLALAQDAGQAEAIAALEEVGAQP